MRELLRLPQMQGLRRVLLATADAHDLYKRFDFAPLAAPQNMLEIWERTAPAPATVSTG
jgi:hypothetical protein